MSFLQTNPELIKINPFSSLKKDWALVTAGNEDNLNTMTVSWGGTGVIWNKCVSFIFIRPQRYTFEFIENSDFYSVCFLEDNHKDILSFCGNKSGRDVNKIKQTGLSPIFIEEAPYFDQSKIVFICRKIYGQFIDPSYFIDNKINLEYPNKDYHKVFIGEIVKCLIKE